MKSLIFLITILPIFLSSCTTTTQKVEAVNNKIDDKLSQGVYAINDSMTVGRFDLAKKYSDQTVRLVAPPSKRVKILPFYGK